MKDRCIVRSIEDLCKCPDKLVREVRIERHGLEKALDPTGILGMMAREELKKQKGTISAVPTGCIFPRATKLKIENTRVDSINGLGKVMPALEELDVQRNNIKSINAKTLPRRLVSIRLDGNPVEKVENGQFFSLLKEISLANSVGKLDISWIEGLENLSILNLSGKSVIPEIYRTRDGKIKKTGRQLLKNDIKELQEYLRTYPIEIKMAEEEASAYDE